MLALPRYVAPWPLYARDADCRRKAKKAEALSGHSAFLSLSPTSREAGLEKVLYSIGGATILSPPIVTIRKSSRRFCCQQVSLCSVHTGRSSP
jgi:hypothetical protein